MHSICQFDFVVTKLIISVRDPAIRLFVLKPYRNGNYNRQLNRSTKVFIESAMEIMGPPSLIDKINRYLYTHLRQ